LAACRVTSLGVDLRLLIEHTGTIAGYSTGCICPFQIVHQASGECLQPSHLPCRGTE
jgi:hypothetical protein